MRMNQSHLYRLPGLSTVCLAVSILMLPGNSYARPSTCSYSTYKWNVNEKKVVDFERVSHSYYQLEDREIDAVTGCTVCEEDQRILQIGNLPPIKICKSLYPRIQSTLNQLINQEEVILKLVGYRVGMTRGDVDSDGNRTLFSNHSFGIAIDINDEQNGLYENCLVFGPNCNLRKGGEWHPDNHGSLTEQSMIVIELRDIGLKWGGKILGHQKDFMHFSPTGY